MQSNGSHGIVAQKGGQCDISECAIEGNALSGVTSVHEGSFVYVRGCAVRGSRVGVYAANRGRIRLDITTKVEANAEADEGCVEDGRIERDRQSVERIMSRPRTAGRRDPAK